MLRRIVALSQGVAGTSDKALPPVETLDGYGSLGRAPATAATIPAGGLLNTVASAKYPPGFYGTEDARQALNLAPAVKVFARLPELPPGVARTSYARGPEVDFRPGLLAAALALGLIDLLIAYALRGLLPGIALKRGAAAYLLLAPLAGGAVLLLLAAAHPARAQGNDSFAIQATTGFHLAYVATGIAAVDAEARAGLVGSANVLNQRSSVEAGDPMAVDVERDELIFFPLLYWPVVSGEAPPSAQAVERINRYLATGGTILFDTQDQGQSTALTAAATQARLQQIAGGLDIRR